MRPVVLSDAREQICHEGVWRAVQVIEDVLVREAWRNPKYERVSIRPASVTDSPCCVIANMVRGDDGKGRTMVDHGLLEGKMTIGAVYRAELAEKG